MSESNNAIVAQGKATTMIGQWADSVVGEVSKMYGAQGLILGDYSRECAINCVSAIYQLVKSTDKVTIKDLNTSNVCDIVRRCASMKLNANAFPREVYFTIRSKKVNDEYVKEIEMGIEGDGYDALLRNFGAGVARVYPAWIVKEGDYFVFPKHKGLEVTPPEWEESGDSTKAIRVVYPVQVQDGTVQYLISERESVKTNLMAHVRQNLLTETFGICASKYKATESEKQAINEKKEEIMKALADCETLDDMLACEAARPYMSAAWRDNPESMIIRKMRNNAIKRFPKDMDALARDSMVLCDDTVQATQDEIEEKENTLPIVFDEEV